jgi:hypothetical protein
MSPENRSIPVWLWLIVWIGCVGVTLAVQPDSTVDRRLHSLQILGKNTEDQETIATNFGEYRKLPASDRRNVKKLHTDLQTEAQLKPVLKEYLEWRELAAKHFPDQVAKLDAETDPVRKALLVGNIVDAQKSRMTKMLQLYSGDPSELREPREPREMTMRRGLSRMELESLRELFEPVIKPMVSSEEWLKIESSSGLPRTVRVLSAAIESMRNGRMRDSGQRPDELYRQLQQALGNGPAAQLLDQQVTSDGKAGALRSLILSGLMRQVSSEPFTKEELEAARKKLERDNPRISNAPPSFRDFWIKVTAISEKYPEFSRIFERQFRESGGPGFGPGGPFRGDGRRGDGPPGGAPGGRPDGDDGKPRDGFGPPFGGRPPFGPPPDGDDNRPRRGPEGRGPEGRGPDDRGPERRPPGERRPEDDRRERPGSPPPEPNN